MTFFENWLQQFLLELQENPPKSRSRFEELRHAFEHVTDFWQQYVWHEKERLGHYDNNHNVCSCPEYNGYEIQSNIDQYFCVYEKEIFCCRNMTAEHKNESDRDACCKQTAKEDKFSMDLLSLPTPKCIQQLGSPMISRTSGTVIRFQKYEKKDVT